MRARRECVRDYVPEAVGTRPHVLKLLDAHTFLLVLRARVPKESGRDAGVRERTAWW